MSFHKHNQPPTKSAIAIGASSKVTELPEEGVVLKFPNDKDLLSREEMSLEALKGLSGAVQLIRTDQSQGCLVLQQAPGIKLSELIRFNGGLSFDDAREIICQIASVLQFMHDRDGGAQVHYDISLSNIFWDPKERDVTLIDFGSSYRLNAIPSEYFDQIFGTPLYLAPEKLVPAPELGCESDIYALGAIWYELVTETPVFDPAIGNLYHQIRTATPFFPRKLAECRRTHALIRSMLEKNVGNRPAASELFEETR